MNYPHLTTAIRSGSLSGSQDAHLSVHTQARRDSEAMRSEGPMTPPMSPVPSEDGCEDREDIIVDAEPRFSGPGDHPAMPSRPPSTADSMDLETVETASEDDDGPKPPLRLLEDEKSHVNKSGGVSLKDFEVKGTLGECPILG